MKISVARAVELVNRVCSYDEMNTVTLEERAAIVELLMKNIVKENKTSKYLEFIIGKFKPRTKAIGVWSRKSGEILGEIKWFSRWRQYTFFPRPETIFNSECLDDIRSYIKDLMDERKKNK